MKLAGAVGGIVPSPQLGQLRHVRKGFLADQAERIPIQSQGLQRQTTPLGWYELDFVATQQERLGVVGLVKVHHVQLVQLTVGQVQVLHSGGQAVASRARLTACECL